MSLKWAKAKRLRKKDLDLMKYAYHEDQREFFEILGWLSGYLVICVVTFIFLSPLGVLFLTILFWAFSRNSLDDRRACLYVSKMHNPKYQVPPTPYQIVINQMLAKDERLMEIKKDILENNNLVTQNVIRQQDLKDESRKLETELKFLKVENERLGKLREKIEGEISRVVKTELKNVVEAPPIMNL